MKYISKKNKQTCGPGGPGGPIGPGAPLGPGGPAKRTVIIEKKTRTLIRSILRSPLSPLMPLKPCGPLERITVRNIIVSTNMFSLTITPGIPGRPGAPGWPVRMCYSNN